jgi:hypothetical protein
MADEYQQMSTSEKQKEDWMNSKWRPMMGWMYMIVCFFDFVLAPVLWSVVQGVFHGSINTQWQPLTLQGAGLFHIAMGAVLGIAAYGRTQEKLNGANNGGLTQGVGTTYVPPTSNNTPSTGQVNTGSFGGSNNGGFSSPQSFGGASTPSPAASGGFGASSSFGSAAAPAAGGFGTAAPTTVAVTASGKKIVPQEPDPIL